MIVRLRPGEPADLDWILDLERRHEGRIGQWPEARHEAAMAAPDREYLVMEVPAADPLGYLIAYDTVAATGGVYLKRILVDVKGQGTGTAVLTAWLQRTFQRPEAGFVWLNVFGWNTGAQSLYRRLGFVRWDPEGEERRRCDEAAEPPAPGDFRMRLDRQAAATGVAARSQPANSPAGSGRET